MLNRKFIVSAVVAVLAFFGILTFALDPNNDGSKDQTSNDNIQEEAGSKEDEIGGEEETEDETTEEQETPSQNVTRPVVQLRDTIAPVISVEPLEDVIEVGSTYDINKGVSATDNIDSTVEIVISGTVDGNVAGIYTITYTATDSSGNNAIATRTVKVKPIIEDIEFEPYEVGDTFVEPKANVKVNVNEPTIQISADNIADVNVLKSGVYNLKFNYTTADGVSADEKVFAYTITDNQLPVITVEHDYNLERPYENVNLKVNVSDNSEVDLSSLKYIWTESSDKPSDDDENWNLFNNGDIISSLPNVSGRYYLYVTAKDINDNTADSKVGPFIIDNDYPSVPEVDFNGYELGQWTKESIVITLNSVDNTSNIKKYQYQLDNDGNWIDIIGNQLTLTGNYNSVIKFRSVDELEHASDETINYTIKEDIEAPIITLKGDNPLTFNRNLFAKYEDPGYELNDNFTPNNQLKVTVTGIKEVDMLQVGEYKIVYTVTDLAGNTSSVTRTVRIIESVKPVIVLNNPLYTDPFVKLNVNVDKYIEYGATAIDCIDGNIFNCTDLTDQIQISGYVDTTRLGTYHITYTVTDWSGNTSSVTRTIKVVDEVKPTITLSNNETITVTYQKPIIKFLKIEYETVSINVPKPIAIDNYDGDVTGKVKISTEYFVFTVRVTYEVTDSNGNKSVEYYRYSLI